MFHRFELLAFDGRRCALQFRADDGAVLLASSSLRIQDEAMRTLEWLRGSLGKDWLYHLGRCPRDRRPLFTLHAPNGTACAGGPFKLERPHGTRNRRIEDSRTVGTAHGAPGARRGGARHLAGWSADGSAR